MRFMMILMILVLATAAGAQDTARVTFAWTQPDTTHTGNPMADGWMKEYRVFVATATDTVMQTIAPAPVALADTAFSFVTLEIGEPSAVRVQAVDKWDQAGLFSDWSDVTIVIPDPPGAAGRPRAVD